MASKHCLQALLTSIAMKHEHVRTYVLTKNYSPIDDLVTFGIAREKWAKHA
jgi:hypothetical protein